MSAILSKVVPTRTLYEGHEYVNADNTDVRLTWARFFAEATKPETADSVQESAIAEHQARRIPGNY